MISYIAMILSLSGAMICALGKPSLMVYAKLIWLVANVLWIYIGINQGLTSLVLTYVGFLLIEGYGLYKWAGYRDVDNRDKYSS